MSHAAPGRLPWARQQAHRDARMCARFGMTAAEYLETQQAEMVARDGVIPWREVEAIARLVWRVA